MLRNVVKTLCPIAPWLGDRPTGHARLSDASALRAPMILTDLDLLWYLKEPFEARSPQQNRIRRLVESIWLRLPRTVADRIQTRAFRKLAVSVTDHWQWPKSITCVLGVAEVFLFEPQASHLPSMNDADIDALVRRLLRRGLEVAAAHDALFAERSAEVLKLVDACADPYEHRMERKAHRSRQYYADLVLCASPLESALEVLIVERGSGSVLERHRIKLLETVDLYFAHATEQVSIRWDGNEIIGSDSGGREVVRIQPTLPATEAKSKRRGSRQDGDVGDV